MEEKTTSSTSNELEKASLVEGSNGVVGKTNNEKSKLVVGLWQTSQNWGEILPPKAMIDREQRRDENFFHQDDREITWIIDKDHNSNIP